jgi:hypothetical protein
MFLGYSVFPARDEVVQKGLISLVAALNTTVFFTSYSDLAAFHR